MTALVDTHALLWFIWNDAKLSAAARTFLIDPNNDLFLSAATLWEIAIKVSIGKLNLAKPFDLFMDQAINDNNLKILPVTVPYCAVAAGLPFHHRDPFDRFMIAQALAEKMPIVSSDVAIDPYSVPRIW